MAQVSDESEAVKEPVLCEPDSVVVASYTIVCPHSNPRAVAFSPPRVSIEPFKVATVSVTPEAEEVVTVGIHGLVVNVTSDPYEVPMGLVA